jgi:hypothetical protein
MRALRESGGNDLLQCSQVGRSSSMAGLWERNEGEFGSARGKRGHPSIGSGQRGVWRRLGKIVPGNPLLSKTSFIFVSVLIA